MSEEEYFMTKIHVDIHSYSVYQADEHDRYEQKLSSAWIKDEARAKTEKDGVRVGAPLGKRKTNFEKTRDSVMRLIVDRMAMSRAS